MHYKVKKILTGGNAVFTCKRFHFGRLTWGTVYDTKDYALEGIDPEYRSMFSPLVICAAVGRISPHMEYATGHSLAFRRYYKVVDY